jgi:segregation and condensation protein B
LKSLDQLPALAEIRDLETLNAELGFEPLAEPAAEPEDVPGLTVVGGTEHTPQSEPESRSEAADGDAAVDGGEGMSLSQAVDDLESRAHDAVPEESEVADAQEANSEHDADHAQDLEGAAEVQNIDKAEPIEERAMYAEDLDAFEDTDSPKPESQS